ncbi:hypothetical protein [Clostridium sp. N3C]|uniref:hypothetical protein n=1 Tax=Clostridium sp. N3C TaxID=1776758 RepID=UPI0015BB366B|nr:hypothetical protein [Clostridium sp. N3C]
MSAYAWLLYEGRFSKTSKNRYGSTKYIKDEDGSVKLRGNRKKILKLLQKHVIKELEKD